MSSFILLRFKRKSMYTKLKRKMLAQGANVDSAADNIKTKLQTNLNVLKERIRVHLKTLSHTDDPRLYGLGLFAIDKDKIGLAVEISVTVYRGPKNEAYATTRMERRFTYWIYKNGFVVHANLCDSNDENDHIMYDQQYDTDDYNSEDETWQPKPWATNETVHASRERLQSQWSFLEPIEDWAYETLVAAA